jgi:DhnA family fructose-bisphosphate aldolase class Ia
VVALDHTFVLGLAQGWERPSETLEKIVAGRPDALLTNYGVIKQFNSMLPPDVGLILRLDGGAPYGEEWNKYTEWRLLHTVDAAVRIGAHGVICMFFLGSVCELETLKIASRVAEEATAAGMPITIEALPIPGRSVPDPFDARLVASAARIAAETGADMIKTVYPRDPHSFRQVTDTCPVPVLIAGGDLVGTDRDLLAMVHGALSAGGKGAFVGRNIWQHSEPTRAIRALMKIMHEGAGVDEALDEFAAVTA